jgi:regulator of replication initiation timing
MKLPTTIEELQKLLLEVLGKLSALEKKVSKLRKENAELSEYPVTLREYLIESRERRVTQAFRSALWQ